MTIVKLKYNPLLSVAENAKLCGVSPSAVRNYLHNNKIDRRYDNQNIRQKQIDEIIKINPNLTIRQIAQLLGWSVNTVQKYLKGNVPKITTDKVAKTDTSKNENIIKSVSNDQHQILINILKLYIKKETFECDLTFSTGGFYKHIQAPLLRFDKYPQSEDIKPLEQAYNIDKGSLSNIIYDLPFIIKPSTAPSTKNNTSAIVNRFTCFSTTKELYGVNEEMLRLSFNLLKANGYLIIKTQDTSYSGKQIWVSNFVINKAIEIGFEMVDKFILTSNHRHLHYTGEQRHARKYHSYFLVLKKL